MISSFFARIAKPIALLVLPLLMAATAPAHAAEGKGAAEGGDAKFAMIFKSWKRADADQQRFVAVPSARPVAASTFTSGFGVRSDPFRRGSAMHAGIDLAGPQGTPVYATADGVVEHAAWRGGYGNLVQISHGKAIETRYGHLSKILVSAGTPVKRGQLIALMGSTGRSTGSHLHYEVRINGRAVNPTPFIEAADYQLAMRAAEAPVALGGPEAE